MVKMAKNTCYVTTPIYYASGAVHIGNSYSTVVCDTFARYQRLRGNDAYFLTGMDEHGLKIEEAANKQGKTPQEFVDEVAGEIKKIWDIMNTSYDRFVRTTDKVHEKQVQKT